VTHETVLWSAIVGAEVEMGRLACPRLFPDMMEGVGLDYSIWSGQLSRVGIIAE
jgi:hypothetical protein